MNDHLLTYVIDGRVTFITSSCCGTRLIKSREQMKRYGISQPVQEIISKSFKGDINPDEINFLRQNVRVVGKMVIH